MTTLPTRILLAGCLVLCALNFEAAFLRYFKGSQYHLDSSSVNVYPYDSGRADMAIPVQNRKREKTGDRVEVYIRNSYDHGLIRGVAVPNL